MSFRLVIAVVDAFTEHCIFCIGRATVRLPERMRRARLIFFFFIVVVFRAGIHPSREKNVGRRRPRPPRHRMSARRVASNARFERECFF
jgi:hypothetical protein